MLRELTEASGISGYETAAAEVAEKHFRPFSDKVEIDKMGNLIALKRGNQVSEKRYKILIAAHIDEIGLMVEIPVEISRVADSYGNGDGLFKRWNTQCH